MVLDAALHLLDFYFTRDHRLLAHAAIAFRFDLSFGEKEQPLDATADFLGKTNPRQSAEHR